MGGGEQYCNDNIITMGKQGGEKQMFNVNLAKVIGLYQMLDPGTITCRDYNVLHIAVTFLMLYLGFMSTVVCANGVYYWNNIHTSSMIFLVGSINFYLMCYKLYVIIKYSGRIWDCLSVARFDFTKHERHDGGRLLDIWQNRSVRTTYVYMFINIIVLLGCVTYPLVFNDTVLEVKNQNSSSSSYRINVLNLHLLASFNDVIYNQHFGVFFFFEAMAVAIYIMFHCIFDMVLITISLALLCQLQMVCTAFESLGHKTINSRRSSANAKSENELTVELDVYNELITIIMDHQAVMQKIDELFNIFQRPTLIQIIMSSVNLIFSWFTITVNYANGEMEETGTLLILQLSSGLLILLFQLYILYYLFGRIHDQKDCIIFSLYSSNWTEMNMKCKKLILLTMMMNNAHQKKLKFTSRNIVNMEMFCRTLRICYTTVSMMLNYRKFKYSNN